MPPISDAQYPETDAIRLLADAAVRAIPPVWPLAASVAVNPYLGQSDLTLAETAALMARVAGAPVTMPRHWYRDRIAAGSVTDADLAAALARADARQRPASLAILKAVAAEDTTATTAVPTIADLTAAHTAIDWPGVIAERLGAWAGGYFDEGQALWAAPREGCAYGAWRAVATHDLTTEIVGLRGFARFVADAPATAPEAIARAVARLRLPDAALPTYFHRLLVDLGGWANYARYRLWQAELTGGTDDSAIGLLAIRLLWEEALFDRHHDRIDADWRAAIATHEAPPLPNKAQIVDAILQDACERAAQRALAASLASAQDQHVAANQPPLLQAAFCIDVRSEVFRRALETVDPRIRTIGFAGFFGLTAAHRRFGSDVVEHRLPVLLPPGLASRAGGEAEHAADQALRYRERAKRAWGRFKLAAVSSFAFVEAAGPAYVVKLIRDALGRHGQALPNDPAPRLDSAIGLPTRIDMAASILRSVSLTKDFAPLVLLVGHGANVVNNPHASGLHCGACGGYSGDVNARLLANLLNDAGVRAGLEQVGIAIPPATIFIAALHDTTTDRVLLYDRDCDASDRAPDIARTEAWLAAAGVIARTERALRLPRAGGGADIARRARDWAETRPEWALAGCKAFIAAPRRRTAGTDLNGRAFLHDYDWRQDAGFGVLELIMTAPVVVASWISLQYYGSAVAPALFGGGNKLLHNVIGGIGVVEGNGGTMRPGLPWQSVHDGSALVHEPLRLSVCIEAPREAMTDILRRHPDVRRLFDNGWLHLFALDERGRMAFRYQGDLQWQSLSEDVAGTPPAQLAA